MEYFFAIIVLIAINIGCFLLFIRAYKSMVREQIASVDKKAGELEAILDSADQMINELNNLSDYLVSHVEQSNIMYEKSHADLNEKIQRSNELAQQLHQLIDECSILKEQALMMKVPSEADFGDVELEDNENIIRQKGEMPLSNPKYIEVMRLAELGLSVRQIAQQLNIGQGEIKLVLDMKK